LEAIFVDAGLPYSSAVPYSRHPTGRRIEVFSPKISRRVCLNGYDALRVWVTLEANPLVTRFCERPAYLDPLENKPSSPCIDFWVQLRGQTDGELWLIEGSPVYDRLSHDGEVPSNLHGLPVRIVYQSYLAGWDIPLRNWSKILPVLVSHRAYHDELLQQMLVVALLQPMTFHEILEAFSDRDATTVQAALFALLIQGRAVSEDLTQFDLGGRTKFRRA
jgi:hypothetical protein